MYFIVMAPRMVQDLVMLFMSFSGATGVSAGIALSQDLLKKP